MTAALGTTARTASTAARAVVLCCVLAVAGCTGGPSATTPPTRPAPTLTASPTPTPTASPAPPPATGGYPWHTGIVVTTFWVGELFDPDAPDGSQAISTYDSDWLGSYGGCDGVQTDSGCQTEPRSAESDYFPSSMVPQENPFYLDLPYDDINDDEGFARRDAVIPWAAEFAAHRGDRAVSYLKNRWVQLVRADATCYGQVEDAGPGEYHDAAYVFGDDDARPANERYGGAGMDVSPALTGCLGLPELDGVTAGVDWRFVEAADVPPGPWLILVTTSPVRNG